MSYPQTRASDALDTGKQVWRLFTTLTSSGDIYESDLSSRALVIGPDSDIARVQATYYDQDAPNNAGSLSVSVTKPYIGRLDALASKTFKTGERARLFFTSIDLAPPQNFRPPGAGIADVIETVDPKIDLLFYLLEVPGYIAPRSDKSFLFEQLPAFTSLNPQWFLIPFYGRRFADIAIKSLGFLGQPAVTIRVYGINFSNNIASGAAADNGHQEELLQTIAIGAPALGSGLTDTRTVSNRSFDYLAIEIDSAGSPFPDPTSITTHITVSDEI